VLVLRFDLLVTSFDACVFADGLPRNAHSLGVGVPDQVSGRADHASSARVEGRS